MVHEMHMSKLDKSTCDLTPRVRIDVGQFYNLPRLSGVDCCGASNLKTRFCSPCERLPRLHDAGATYRDWFEGHCGERQRSCSACYRVAIFKDKNAVDK